MQNGTKTEKHYSPQVQWNGRGNKNKQINQPTNKQQQPPPTLKLKQITF